MKGNESYCAAYRAIDAHLRRDYGQYLAPHEMRYWFGDEQGFREVIGDKLGDDHRASLLREAAEDYWTRAVEPC